MFSLDVFENQFSQDYKYFIQGTGEKDHLCVREIPREILGKKLEIQGLIPNPILGFISRKKFCAYPRYRATCGFIRSDFLWINNEIYDIKTGFILDSINDSPYSYLAQEEIFVFRATGFYTCHLNYFLIFRLWSFIACIFKEDLLDPGLFLNIYDFVKPYPRKSCYT